MAVPEIGPIKSVSRTHGLFAFQRLDIGNALSSRTEADAKGVISHLGGLLDGYNKLPPNFKLAFQRLFLNERRWDTRVFRVLISPFYLRRTIASRWMGEFIVSRSVARPSPVVLTPLNDGGFDPEVVAVMSKKKWKVPGAVERRLNLQDLMERADTQRFLAWSTVYRLVLERNGMYGQDPSDKKLRAAEDIVFSQFAKFSLSGGGLRLISLLKTIVETKSCIRPSSMS